MRRTLLLLSGLVLLLVALGPATGSASADTRLDPTMAALWQRTDGPVANGSVNRSWLWGPQANHILTEPYTYAPLQDNQRLDAYFDKSRMEINDPTGDPTNAWYVTNGRLVYEMMTGKIQVGQNPDVFTTSLPASIPVAGDPNSYETPTYQTLGRLMGNATDQTGQLVTATLDQNGTVGESLSPLAKLHQAEYVSYPGPGNTTIRHNIPDVFWMYLTQQISALVTPANWVFVTGYPLTKAYWAHAIVGGSQTDVMVQCIERRCLTYTPSNNNPYKVEMGNVGQHYYAWRYQDTWAEGQPVNDPSITTPSGLYQPIRGFGKVWREAPGVQDRLGWATQPEQGSSGEYQRFNYGTMIQIGTPNEIWVFYGDLYWQMTGTWEVYPNTFIG